MTMASPTGKDYRMKIKTDQYYLDIGSSNQTRIVESPTEEQLPGQTTFDLIDTSITYSLIGDGTIVTI